MRSDEAVYYAFIDTMKLNALFAHPACEVSHTPQIIPDGAGCIAVMS
jgi:hypothetical protein